MGPSYTSDYWIVKTDTSGVKQWDARFGGSDYDYFYSLQQTTDGGYILGGDSNSGISGDKTQASQGGADYWIVKLYPDPLFCSVTTIITPSGSTEFCKPGSVTLNAPVDAGYTYQWKRNGVNIPGAISAIYTTTKTGNYQVEVSNGTCSDFSDELSVTATAKPNAVINNLDATNDLCIDISIKLKATNDAGYTYQWRKDSAVIPGATSNIYFATSAGNYSVKVTNTSGCTKISALYAIIEKCREGLIAENKTSLMLYPNPTNGNFTVSLQINEAGSNEAVIQVWNMLGEVMFEENAALSDGIVQKEIQFAEHASSGIYTVQIIVNDKVFQSQVIYQN